MQFAKWMSLEFIRYLEYNTEEYNKKHWAVEGFNKEKQKISQQYNKWKIIHNIK